jgi:hypothetical protein
MLPSAHEASCRERIVLSEMRPACHAARLKKSHNAAAQFTIAPGLTSGAAIAAISDLRMRSHVAGMAGGSWAAQDGVKPRITRLSHYDPINIRRDRDARQHCILQYLTRIKQP